MPEGEDRRRLFLALWPDPALQSALAGLARSCQVQCGGRLVPERNLHATLVFLGDLSATQADAVCACVDDLPPPCVTLQLDRVGFWRKPGIVWAGSRATPDAVTAYAGSLQDALRRLGFRIDPRPWTLHVTLVRRARKRPRMEVAPLTWCCGEVLLMASKLDPEGARYESVRRWSAPVDMG